MSALTEFKDGNVVDMAVGVIIGSAVGKIVSPFVADVLCHRRVLLIGGVDFTDLATTLSAMTEGGPAVVIAI